MILQPRSVVRRRRSGFTLLEVLTVVAIILVLASIATVAVLQILKDNKDDQAKINANSLAGMLRMYMVRHDAEPQSIQDLLPLLEGGDASKLMDPWGKEYQIGKIEQNGTTSYYIYTISGNTGEEIRSDVKNR